MHKIAAAYKQVINPFKMCRHLLTNYCTLQWVFQLTETNMRVDKHTVVPKSWSVNGDTERHVWKLDTFESAAKDLYLVTNLTNKNYIPKDVESRLNSERACYCSYQNPLSSSLLSKNIKFKIQRNIILHVVLLCGVLRLRIEERPPIWRVAANKLNKQSWTADKGWSSSLGGWARC